MSHAPRVSGHPLLGAEGIVPTYTYLASRVDGHAFSTPADTADRVTFPGPCASQQKIDRGVHVSRLELSLQPLSTSPRYDSIGPSEIYTTRRSQLEMFTQALAGPSRRSGPARLCKTLAATSTPSGCRSHSTTPGHSTTSNTEPASHTYLHSSASIPGYRAPPAPAPSSASASSPSGGSSSAETASDAVHKLAGAVQHGDLPDAARDLVHRIVRVDQAGELGANWIYRGQKWGCAVRGDTKSVKDVEVRNSFPPATVCSARAICNCICTCFAHARPRFLACPCFRRLGRSSCALECRKLISHRTCGRTSGTTSPSCASSKHNTASALPPCTHCGKAWPLDWAQRRR